MFATNTRTILPVFALLLTLLGPAAPPAHAQALPRPVIHKLIKIRTKQAFAVDAEIQKTQRALARAPLAAPALQNLLAQEQAVLAGIQAQIALLTQLLAAEDQADALWNLIKKTKKAINEAKNQQIKAALQALLSTLQADLAATQAAINVIQSQIVL